MNTNAFASFKPYKKHPTSEWPLFSDFLDETFDIATAPHQYLFWLTCAFGIGCALRSKQFLMRATRVPALDLMSQDFRADFFSQVARYQSAFFIPPLLIGTACVWHSGKHRTAEQDRDGARYNEYFRRSRHCGVDDETAILLAKDIVMRTDTMKEGRELLDRALTHLAEQELIPEPQFTKEGLYIIPEYLRTPVEGGMVTPSGVEAQGLKDNGPQAVILPKSYDEFGDMLKLTGQLPPSSASV